MTRLQIMEFVETQTELVGIKLYSPNKPIKGEHLFIFNDDRSAILNDEEVESLETFVMADILNQIIK